VPLLGHHLFPGWGDSTPVEKVNAGPDVILQRGLDDQRVHPVGIEPTLHRLKGEYSTLELRMHVVAPEGVEPSSIG
jgi:hypothetical protein